MAIKYKILKTLFLVLIVILIASIIGGTIYVFGVIEPQKKRGLIIVPSILGSALYDGETGEAVWDPLSSKDVWLGNFMKHDPTVFIGLIFELLKDPKINEEVSHLLANNGYGDGQGFVNKVAAIDEDGNPKNNLVPASFDEDTRYKYGMLYSLYEIVNYYEKNYGDYYEVSVFQYDWRLDNLYNAELLEQYINKKGYDEIILVSHSTGGLVSAGYLARGEENRKKVTLNISYSTPYLGSVVMLNYLETKDDFADLISSVANVKGLKQYIEPLKNAYYSQAEPLFNMYSIYQMLPTYELLTSSDYCCEFKETIRNGTVNKVKTTLEYSYFGILLNWEHKQAFKNAKALYKFYCSRPWARKSDGTLREPIKNWLDYCESMYVENENGERVHVTELVNTVYIAGVGIKTNMQVRYNLHEGEYYYSDYVTSTMGDGMTSFASSVAGTDDYDRMYLANNYRHFEIVTNFTYEGAEITDRVFEAYLPQKEKNYIKLKSILTKKE